jgi:hypothetical protein
MLAKLRLTLVRISEVEYQYIFEICPNVSALVATHKGTLPYTIESQSCQMDSSGGVLLSARRV